MAEVDAFIARMVTEIVNPIMYLLAAGASLIFVWGVFKFIAYAGDEHKRAEGRSSILWGIVGLVIIFGVYGLLNIATGTFGIGAVQKISE